MILPETISGYANRTLDTLRRQSSAQICPGSDGTALLTMRAELMRWPAASRISANGCCQLLPTQDRRWLALNLPRPSDWELLPALFGTTSIIDNWEAVAEQVSHRSAAALLTQGRLLGLPLALAEKTLPANSQHSVAIVCRGSTVRRNRQQAARVLDLSSLWAGPLCSQLLQQSGAEVIKVESKQRPDAARLSSDQTAQAFYNWLNQNKQLVELDFAQAEGIQQLTKLIAEADIVIEGSRPRALQQLGIDAEALVKQQPGLVWVSITGYGRQPPQANWVAFGDDAAISAGLYGLVDELPVFIGDAIADPLTGLQAALIAQHFWQQGEAVLLDINLHTVARHATATHF